MGPFSVFQRLVREWTRDKGMTPREVATKVKVSPLISLWRAAY